MAKNLPQPCPDCPWRRSTRPGALGGSPPETFIGQAFGAYVLPCHNACDFGDPDWKAKAIDTPQCAGAAIFRANVGIGKFLPPVLHKLPSDPGLVFNTAAEFLAHHREIPIENAEDLLAITPPHELLARQLLRPTNTFHVTSTK